MANWSDYVLYFEKEGYEYRGGTTSTTTVLETFEIQCGRFKKRGEYIKISEVEEDRVTFCYNFGRYFTVSLEHPKVVILSDSASGGRNEDAWSRRMHIFVELKRREDVKK